MSQRFLLSSECFFSRNLKFRKFVRNKAVRLLIFVTVIQVHIIFQTKWAALG